MITHTNRAAWLDRAEHYLKGATRLMDRAHAYRMAGNYRRAFITQRAAARLLCWGQETHRPAPNKDAMLGRETSTLEVHQ